MGSIIGDWLRGTTRVGNQQKFDRLCRKIAAGRGTPGDEHIARGLAVKLGIQPEPEPKQKKARRG